MMLECPMCWEYAVDEHNYEKRGIYTHRDGWTCQWQDIVECEECHVKLNISFDIDGASLSLLKALP